MSLAHIWWFDVLYITICGGNIVLLVLIFHTMLSALQPVAAGLLILGMMQERQVQSILKLVRCGSCTMECEDQQYSREHLNAYISIMMRDIVQISPLLSKAITRFTLFLS